MTGHLPSAASRPRTTRSLAALAALLATAVLVAAACGSGARVPTTQESSGGDAAGGVAPLPAATAGPFAPSDQAASEDWNRAPTQIEAISAPLIVRTGQIDLEVVVLDDALAAAEKAVTAAGGYVAASQRHGDGDTAGALVTYRIPVERWDATLASLREVGSKVLSEQTSSEEVTSQVVDLGARLANLRVTEAALQAIMAKAIKIPDVLEVQAQLSAVRQEIEQLTAQKQALEKQAALATLTVGFSLPPAVAVTQVQEGWDPARELDQAAATLVGIGQGLVNAAIWVAVVVLPLALVLGVLAAAVLLAVRRVRRRPLPPTPPAAAEAPAA